MGREYVPEARQPCTEPTSWMLRGSQAILHGLRAWYSNTSQLLRAVESPQKRKREVGMFSGSAGGRQQGFA